MSKRILTLGIVALVLLSVAATPCLPNELFDDFNSLTIKQPGDTDNDPYWWIIQDGNYGQQYYAECGDASCTTAEQEGSTTFARLRLFHDDATPGDYLNSEVAEMQTGYAYGQPARWLPTPGHPVTATARVRFSSNYHSDGSGGAVGTAGFILWNSPVDIPNQAYHPATFVGFNWMEQDGVGIPGFRACVMRDTVPVYCQPVTHALDEWMELKFKWSAIGVDNKQGFRFWVDGDLVGSTQLNTPLPALSVEMWNDNQYPTILEDGTFAVGYHNPPGDQAFDVDYVRIEQR
jgi:hypothetical protein